MEKKIEVRAVSILLGVLALAVALILVAAPPGETQTAPEADLSLDKHSYPDTVAVGDTFSYNLDVANLGPNVATGASITDVLPANVIILYTYAEDGSCTTSAGNVVTCDFDDIGPGIETFAYIQVCATEPGILTNNATISSDTVDPNPANNTDTETTTVIPETPEPCPDPDSGPGPRPDPPGPGDGPVPGPGPYPGPGPDDPAVVPGPGTPHGVEGEVVYAPSLEADQETDQDSGDVDQLMEGSPGGSQDANTGNFAVPYQDINW